ncbi:hypothetical protein ACFL20_07280 [Spirochaetota bacterium]
MNTDNGDINTEEELENNMAEEAEANLTQPSNIKNIFKILLIVVIIMAGFYFIYFKATSGRAEFYISDKEITVTGDAHSGPHSFIAKSRIYFHVSRSGGKKLNADIIVLEINKFKENSFKKYKKLSFEVARDFGKLAAYIPKEYFSAAGKYKIKATIDGLLVKEIDLTIIEEKKSDDKTVKKDKEEEKEVVKKEEKMEEKEAK